MQQVAKCRYTHKSRSILLSKVIFAHFIASEMSYVPINVPVTERAMLNRWCLIDIIIFARRAPFLLILRPHLIIHVCYSLEQHCSFFDKIDIPRYILNSIKFHSILFTYFVAIRNCNSHFGLTYRSRIIFKFVCLLITKRIPKCVDTFSYI